MRAPVGPAEGHMNVLQVTRISAGLASWLAAHASQELSQERQDDQSHPLPDSVISSDRLRRPLRLTYLCHHNG